MTDNDNDRSKETTSGVEKTKKNKEKEDGQLWAIRHVPLDIRDDLVRNAAMRNLVVGRYLEDLVIRDRTSLKDIPEHVRQIALEGAKALGVTVSEYVSNVLSSQSTTLNNIDHEALSAAMKAASRVNMPLSHFASTALLKEAHEVLQGSSKGVPAVVPGQEVMTVDRVQEMMTAVEESFLKKVEVLIQDKLTPRESFLDKLKEKMFK